MTLLRALDRYWLASVPAERIAVLRVLTGGFALVYLLVRASHLTGYANFSNRDFNPVGIVSVLAAPLPGWVSHFIFGLALVSGAQFVVGAHYRFSGPVFAAGFLWITSYRSSWGMVFHQDNLVALHLLVLALAPAAAAWSYDARGKSDTVPAHGSSGWAVRAMCWVTVVSYVLAGIAKLRNTGLEWSAGEVLRTHVAYDAVRKLELGGIHSPIGAWLVEYEWPFGILAALTLFLELGAPAALLGKRLAAAWVLGVWAFHVGVIALMAITFAYPVSGCAFACFFAVERLPRHRLLKRFFR